MRRQGEVTLVYLHQSNDEDGNPTIEEYTHVVKCSLIDAFSLNYYQNQSRDMRRTRNIGVAKHYTFDHVDGDKRYKLEFADLGTTRYKITNILLDRNSSLKMILDCDEVMNV